MNVLHIISGGEKGGSKNHLLNLSKSLKDNGIKSIIVCLMKGSLYEEAVNMGLNIILLKQPKRFDLSVVGKLKEVCIRESIDIVNSHGGRANFLCWFLMKSYKAKYVTTIHSDYINDYKGNIYKTAIYSNINRLAIKSFDGYITVSHNFRDMLVERGFSEKNIFVVYNGIDFEKEMVKTSREDIIKEYGLKEHKNFVSMVARLHPIKGHMVFLEACKKIIEDGIDVGIILVGDGNIRNELEGYVRKNGMQNNVYFTGFQPPEKLISLSDFTVLTSYSESFPLVILESALYEKAVISTEVGGIPMLIEDGENGYLIAPGDSNMLADRMRELFENNDKCKNMGKKLYIKAKKCYSLNNMANDYIKIYKNLLTGGQIDG